MTIWDFLNNNFILIFLIIIFFIAVRHFKDGDDKR